MRRSTIWIGAPFTDKGASLNHLFASRLPVAALLLLFGAFTATADVARPLKEPAENQNQTKAQSDILLAAGLYTRWPTEAFEASKDGSSFLKIGIVGRPAYGKELDALTTTKQIAGRRVIVHNYPAASDVRPCQILFITSSVARADRLALIERFDHSPVLLVGETPGFCLEGGSLNFHVENGKVKFALNPQSLAQKKLVVDPRFMRLARPSTTAETKNDKKP